MSLLDQITSKAASMRLGELDRPPKPLLFYGSNSQFDASATPLLPLGSILRYDEYKMILGYAISGKTQVRDHKRTRDFASFRSVCRSFRRICDEIFRFSPEANLVSRFSRIGDLNPLPFLLSLGANPAAFNDLAIRMACKYNQEEMVRFLMSDPRTDPSALGNECMISASEKGFDNLVKLLLEDKRVIDGDNREALNKALDNGHFGVVKCILRNTRLSVTKKDTEQAKRRGYDGMAVFLKKIESPDVISFTEFRCPITRYPIWSDDDDDDDDEWD
eukprot:TRINITY_DN9497_c0_g1_i1.p1 TRINITY_DN9497_c0_g1~~TRINITY_DN9497_c0_g1_i1.p1  ORF type:complete len:275 (-),score=58.48 TRINITY_DN9497_c0_g1_i1:6-830(-)